VQLAAAQSHPTKGRLCDAGFRESKTVYQRLKWAALIDQHCVNIETRELCAVAAFRGLFGLTIPGRGPFLKTTKTKR
jgi:hypothetical protein